MRFAHENLADWGQLLLFNQRLMDLWQHDFYATYKVLKQRHLVG